MSIKLIFAATAALAMAAGTPAFAAKDGQSEQNSAAGGGRSAEEKGEKKKCKIFDASENRLDRKKLCLTREQWKKFEAEQETL